VDAQNIGRQVINILQHIEFFIGQKSVKRRFYLYYLCTNAAKQAGI